MPAFERLLLPPCPSPPLSPLRTCHGFSRRSPAMPDVFTRFLVFPRRKECPCFSPLFAPLFTHAAAIMPFILPPFTCPEGYYFARLPPCPVTGAKEPGEDISAGSSMLPSASLFCPRPPPAGSTGEGVHQPLSTPAVTFVTISPIRLSADAMLFATSAYASFSLPCVAAIAERRAAQPPAPRRPRRRDFSAAEAAVAPRAAMLISAHFATPYARLRYASLIIRCCA